MKRPRAESAPGGWVDRWTAVPKEVIAEARSHRLGGEAARMAYYGFVSFLSVIPLILAVTGAMGGEQAFDRFLAWLQDALPGVAFTSLERFVGEVRNMPRPGLVSAGAGILLWAASNAVGALTLTLNVTFGAGEPRPWWRRRVLVLFVAAAGTVGLAVGSAVDVVGPALLGELGIVQLSAAWRLLRGPAVFTVLTTAAYLLYAFLPNVTGPRSKRPLLAGAAVGTAIWMAVTLLFRLSLHALGRYGSVYGVMTGVIALQVWLYLTAFGVLLGAEVAAALDRRARRSGADAARLPRGSGPAQSEGRRSRRGRRGRR